MIYLFINIKVSVDSLFQKQSFDKSGHKCVMVIKPRLTPPLPAVYKKIKCRFCIGR